MKISESINTTTSTFSGQIAGAASVDKTGTGTLRLSGANAYSGGTAVTTGRLVAGRGDSLGSGAVTVGGGAVLQLDFASSYDIANSLSGTGGLDKTGAGIARLTSNSTIGAVDVQAGGMTVASGVTLDADSYRTRGGASTSLEENAKLNAAGAFVQDDNAVLRVAIGAGTGPSITADNAQLGGALNITGLSGTGTTRATTLDSYSYRVIETTGGIQGDFLSLDLGTATSPVDYLTLTGGVSADRLSYDIGLDLTWFQGNAIGNGVFTIADADTFTVDVDLVDRRGSYVSGWDGSTLTKGGQGTLVLEAENTYRGATLIRAGTLSTTVDDAFAQSSSVSISQGATLALNGTSQMARNLTGGGSILLGAGAAALQIESLVNGEFSGTITGSGSLVKSGAGTLVLSGANTYDGGTTVENGRLVATSPVAVGTGAIELASATSTLELRFATDGSVDNQITGIGALNKTGSGTATLAASSTVGAITLDAGGLTFASGEDFAATSFSMARNTIATLGPDATLYVDGAFSQAADSQLHIDIGSTAGPAITATTATIGGKLVVTGINAGSYAAASELAATQFDVLSAQGGITGNFSSEELDATSGVDYITLFSHKNQANTLYSIGMGLTWNAGAARGNGVFTLAAGDTFDVDVALLDQNYPFASRWTGRDLTKRGDGTLVLSAANQYTGVTLISAGTLSLTADNAIAASGSVSIAQGASLALNSGVQTLQNLAGAGTLDLGTASLIAANSTATEFTGRIAGSGSLEKQGTGSLRLSGANTYTGGTTVDEGRLIAASANALGTGLATVGSGAVLELNLASDADLDNQLLGQGTVEKTGGGTVTLDSSSSVGAVDVRAGGLAIADNGQLSASEYTTRNGATTVIGADSLLTVSGTFTQAAGSTLEVVAGAGQGPSVSADRAELAGTLNVSGLTNIVPPRSSELSSTSYRVVTTTDRIDGDFTSISLGTILHPYDYITLSGGVVDGRHYDVGFGLTWLAGNVHGNGVFTLGDGEEFTVDDVLENQNGPFSSRWTGQDLYKNGNGNLVLAARNTYTGQTNILAGTLTTAVDNAFANSGNVTISSGATLNLAGNAQRVNNLAGAGTIQLGGAVLTAANTSNTSFSGSIQGSGSLSKTGTGQLTLSGVNSHTGGTTVTQGVLVATSAAALGQGSATANDGGILRLGFAGTETVDNQLLGTGTVEKAGAGTAILTNASSDVGNLRVAAGTLSLEQDGVLKADSYTTKTGAATVISGASGLEVSGVFTQESGSALSVTIGSFEPVIQADRAEISGTLHVDGFAGPDLSYASAVNQKTFTIIETVNGISGNFGTVDLGEAVTSADYLTVSAHKSQDGNKYQITSGLTWFAGASDGNGVFTLVDADDSFTVDMDLDNQNGPFVSRWTGRDLTKRGLGTLYLSEQNSYTGNTVVEEGTLAAGVENAYQNSANVIVESDGTLALGGYDQIARNLTGSGRVTLDGATLTVDVDATLRRTVEFSGTISGLGDVVKIGGGTWIVSGINSYSDGTTVAEGRLVATNGKALGDGEAVVADGAVLELAFATDQDFANTISGGTGAVEKTGNGTVRFSGANSRAGTVDIRAGNASFAQNGAFGAATYTTRDGAATSIGMFSTLQVDGAYTQEDGATLNVEVGSGNNPSIVANSATIGGNLNVTGLAPELTARRLTTNNFSFTILDTNSVIDGDFIVDFGGAMTGVDYLVLSGEKTNGGFDYEIGFGLAWDAGPAQGTGSFTMNSPANMFVVDVELNDRNDVAQFASGWNGKDLTKSGAGTLVLAAQNGYTGNTSILGGILVTGVENAFANSEAVRIASGAELQLGGYDQVANNLTGSGAIGLDQAILTVNNDTATRYGGNITGDGGSIFKTGEGTLVLSGNNTYTGGTTVNDGRLVADGYDALGTGEIGLAADAELQLHFEENGTYTNRVTGNGVVAKTGAGQAQIGNTFADFGGVTRIENGALILGDAASGDHRLGGTAVEVAPGAMLAGSGSVSGTVNNAGTIAALNAMPGYSNAGSSNLSVGKLTNSGDIRLAGAQVGNTLTVNGGMVGSGGRLHINTVLGGDDSPTDRLVLDGGRTTGTTGVLVYNRGGTGGAVEHGIKIVDAINGATTTDDAFFLSTSSPGYRSGVNTLAIGAFDYDLVKGGWGGDPESWYLVSERVLRPETGMYLANRETAVSLFHHSMRDRLEGYEAGVDRETGRKFLGRAWGRIQASHLRYSSDNNAMRTKAKTYLLHTGIDMISLSSASTGLVKAGFMAGLGHASGRTRSQSEGALSSKGSFGDYLVGVYGTWFQDQERLRGLYADTWIQHSWQRNKTAGDGLPTEKYNSRVWTGSIEAGYAIPVYESENHLWSIIPAAQAIFGHYSSDDVVEASGTRVTHEGKNQVTTRVGARLQGNIGMVGSHPTEPFIEANWLHRSTAASILMNADSVVSGSPRDLVEIKLGFDAEIRRNMKLGLSVLGKFGKNNYKQFGGQVAIDVEW